MVRILMLDLGDTLVDGQHPFPHVPEALEVIRGLKTAAGEPLAICLVSDFDVETQPATPAKIEARFQDFLKLLAGFGLREFFEPVTKRVTISAQAKVRKPNRKIFETAIKRLGMQAPLSDCLFITENADHIRHCREDFGMQTLQFGGHVSPTPVGAHFTDWSAAPLMIAHIVAPAAPHNLVDAAGLRLRALHPDWEVGNPESISGNTIRVQARPWVPLHNPKLGDWDGVHVQMPVTAEAKLDAQGRVTALAEGKPSQEDLDEAVQYVMSQRGTQKMSPTHAIETDAQGRRLLKRKRFSAW